MERQAWRSRAHRASRSFGVEYVAPTKVREESGLPCDERLVSRDTDTWAAENGCAAMKRLLDDNPDLTAVFCATDLLAIGALSALYERSVRVPDDVSVIGFDDSELSRHSALPLTSMRIHSRDMAKAPVRRLVERLQEPGAPAVWIDFPIDLVERKSCSRPPRRG
jgi:DNA-binding LacI/PurR family transcriptional regulator